VSECFNQDNEEARLPRASGCLYLLENGHIVSRSSPNVTPNSIRSFIFIFIFILGLKVYSNKHWLVLSTLHQKLRVAWFNNKTTTTQHMVSRTIVRNLYD